MKIDRNEIYRYLGIKSIAADSETRDWVEQCIEELEGISTDRFCYRLFRTEETDGGILLPECGLLLEGADMSGLLGQSDYCAVMAATLGVGVDRRIAFYARTQLAKGTVLDACATAAIEALCDEVEEKIRLQAKEKGLEITRRFSPGYGDFPLAVQESLLNTLNAYRQIGLTVTESCIMVPRKSVTAVIGLYREKSAGEKAQSGKGCRRAGCPDCGIERCQYRKDGDINGKNNA